MATTALDVREQVHVCLRLLSERCDGAVSTDHEGFNKIDAAFGRRLADAASLTLPQFVVGAKMIRKYRRQLESGGLHIPSPQEIEAYLAEQKTLLSSQQPELPVQGVVSEKAAEKRHRVFVEHGRIIVEYPYDRSIYAALAPLKKTVQGWAFDRYERKEWSYPLESVNLVLDALHPFQADFYYSPEIAVVIEQVRQDAELARQQSELEQALQELERQAALEAVQPYLAGAPVANGQMLYAHQQEAVRFLIGHKRVILAHDLGLGKTRTALIAAKGYGLPVFVVCPAGLRINWLREAEAVQVPIEVYSWAKLPEPTEDHDYILIGDEVHYCQTLSTRRTKGFLELAEHARAVYALTGTPIKNGRPINLYPLLVACKHPLAQDLRAYERRYCNAHYKPIGRKREVWDVTGASHLDELHQQAREVLLYKKKEECLKDLPPKMRIMRQVEVDREGERAYTAMIERLRHEHDLRVEQKREARTQTLRVELGEDFDEEALQSELAELGEDEENARALVELGILRHAGSSAKVASALDIAQEVLEQGGSIVLFTAFRDTAARLAEELQADALTGESTTEERQAMIDRFQARESRMLVCMIGAGGVGITLTAAQTVVLVDRPWTPGDAVQCEDRLYRIGQAGSVTALWLQFGLVDERIDALLQQKQERIDLVLRGKRKTMRGVSRSIRSMAKEILSSIQSGVPIEELLGLGREDESDEDIPGGQVIETTLAQPTHDGPLNNNGTKNHAKDEVSIQVAPAPVADAREQSVPSLSEEAEAPVAAAPAVKVKEQSKKDGRLKGQVRRVRKNIMLDEEVVAFLETMKASSQTAAKEGGYSGFLEQLVRQSDEYQVYRRRTKS